MVGPPSQGQKAQKEIRERTSDPSPEREIEDGQKKKEQGDEKQGEEERIGLEVRGLGLGVRVSPVMKVK